jgi:hypothetical protein
MNRLARVLFALVVAFVVVTRTEAAAEHCRQLAETGIPAAAPSASDAPCHGAHAKAEPERPAHHQDQPDQERCECLAVLTGYAAAAPAVSCAHIEPYAWQRPRSAEFASIDPSPDFRPPRA